MVVKGLWLGKKWTSRSERACGFHCYLLDCLVTVSQISIGRIRGSRPELKE